MPEDKTMPASQAYPHRWAALFILLLASFMNMIDVTIVNVALPSMQANLGASESQIQWVAAGYVLAFALGLLPFGRLGDIVGRKMMFLTGVSAFTLTSALCGMAPSIEWLIAARLLQGLSGAMMTPQVLAIAQVMFPREERGGAFSLFGLTAGMASVAGPLAGGLLVGLDFMGLDWRPIFLVNVPLGILAIGAGLAIIPHTPRHHAMRNDLLGIALFSLAILLLIYPLIQGRDNGWPLWSFAMIGSSVVAMVLFYLWQRHRSRAGQSQLLPLTLMHNRNYLIGMAMTVLFFSGVPGLFLVLALFFQSGFGLTPIESGLTTIPFPIGIMIASFISGRLGSRFLSWRVAVGSLAFACGMALLHFTITGVHEAIDHWDFVPPLLISGIGLGIGISGLFQTILSGVPPQDAGSGSGALQAFQQVGGALSIAIIGQIFFSSLGSAGITSKAAAHAAFVNAASHATWYVIGVFVLVAALVPFLRPLPQRGRQQAAPVVAEI
jgi:EmrB/QacA subfamily drug resistance transporter